MQRIVTLFAAFGPVLSIRICSKLCFAVKQLTISGSSTNVQLSLKGCEANSAGSACDNKEGLQSKDPSHTYSVDCRASMIVKSTLSDYCTVTLGAGRIHGTLNQSRASPSLWRRNWPPSLPNLNSASIHLTCLEANLLNIWTGNTNFQPYSVCTTVVIVTHTQRSVHAPLSL